MRNKGHGRCVRLGAMQRSCQWKVCSRRLARRTQQRRVLRRLPPLPGLNPLPRVKFAGEAGAAPLSSAGHGRQNHCATRRGVLLRAACERDRREQARDIATLARGSGKTAAVGRPRRKQAIRKRKATSRAIELRYARGSGFFLKSHGQQGAQRELEVKDCLRQPP
jgi:hypothetical protein